MNLVNARARYLTAIGAVLPSLAMAACKDPPPPGVAMADGGSTTTAPLVTTPSASASASASATATALPPLVVPSGPNPQFRMPSCPSGAFCITEGAKTDPKTAAPAPYAKCSLTVVHPEDAKEFAKDAGTTMFRSRSVSFSAENTAAERTKTATACCYTWVIPCPGGRVFRDATGTPSVARTVERPDWTAPLGALAIDDLSPAERSSLAAHWTREAAFEHASIASFAQLTLDLLSVGAPPELLAAAQRATLDEIEHARISFAIAAAYGGGAQLGPASLAALPGANRTLADVARTTFIDACVGESVASAALADESRQASDPVLSDLLATMAADEERHAELAWRIVAWTLRSGGPEVVRALAAAQADVIDELVALTADASTSAQHELRATVLREVVLPCSVALLTGSEAHGADSPELRFS